MKLSDSDAVDISQQVQADGVRSLEPRAVLDLAADLLVERYHSRQLARAVGELLEVGDPCPEAHFRQTAEPVPGCLCRRCAGKRTLDAFANHQTSEDDL